jgi:putative ABC transport system permease protein
LALAAREGRGSAGRLAFFAVCLSVGVAAVVGVAGLSQALDDGIRGQARQLLAADLAVESRRPIGDEVVAAARSLSGARTAGVREMASVVSVPTADPSDSPGPSLLCELKGVDPGYPFYGQVVTTPDLPPADLLGSDRVLVGPELLTRLGTAIGDNLRVGGATYRIAGIIDSEPDRLKISFTLGPRILMSTDGLDRSGLVALGSRVTHRLLIRLPDGTTAESVDAAATVLRSAIADPSVARVETAAEAQPNLRRGLARVESYLGLVALLSLLVGGIGVAQAVRAWLAGRLHGIAILRALGVRPREVFGLYLGQTAVLALLGSTVGAVAGAAVAQAVPGLLEGLLPIQIEVGWQPAAMIRGMLLGLGVAVLFGLRPLFDVVRVPPVRVLRRGADPLALDRRVAVALGAVLVAGIAVTAAIQSGSLVRGLWFAAGMVVVSAALTGGAYLVMRSVARAPRTRGPVSLRHGLAALARPGAGTLGAVVALGLGVVTVLGMHLVQQRLSAQLDADLPANAPTAFLVDIQPDQWDGVRRQLEAADAVDVDSVEVVMARLRRVAGVPVDQLVARDHANGAGDDRRWVLTREQRLTSLAQLPADNKIVAGALWSDPERPEVSIEQDYAADLGVTVGDTLVLDVQGVELELLVSSIRTVDWGQFTINFFLVVEPGVLDGAPRYRIAAARVPPATEGDLQNRLAATYPNVTMLRVREVLDKVMGVLEQVGFGVRLLGGFTVFAGIAILAGAVSAQSVRRGREVALYKTLGMTRFQVMVVFAVEYALIGLVAGVIGAVGATGLAFAVTHFGMDLRWAWEPATLGLAVVTTTALSVTAGLAASLRPLAVRPLAILRQGR